MNSIGSSSALRRALFPQGFAGDVMAIIEETWQAFSRHRDVRLEDNITALFHIALKQAYKAAGRSWIVTLEDPITDPIYGTQLGRNDLRFYPPEHDGQSIHFAVECKRLHVRTKSTFKHLADKYVIEGLQRFVSEDKYSIGMPYGGMIGYVMDNRIDEAFIHVKAEINARRPELKMEKENSLQEPSVVLPKCSHSADTLHTRSDGELIIHHLLVETSRYTDPT